MSANDYTAPAKSREVEADRVPEDHAVDIRRQLVNEGRSGAIEEISISEIQITSLHGIMLDLDVRLMRDDVLPGGPRPSPSEFYKAVVCNWLSRHPALQSAQVLNSGGGLHVNLLFDSPVEIDCDGTRQRWSGITRAVQAVLPTDPDCPGITAMTRVAGSMNGKTGTEVSVLHPGSPIPVSNVLELYSELRHKPFSTIAAILFGSGRISPCPVCHHPDSSLMPMDIVGTCYGKCGKVKLAQLYDVFLTPRSKGA